MCIICVINGCDKGLMTALAVSGDLRRPVAVALFAKQKAVNR